MFFWIHYAVYGYINAAGKLLSVCEKGAGLLFPEDPKKEGFNFQIKYNKKKEELIILLYTPYTITSLYLYFYR